MRTFESDLGALLNFHSLPEHSPLPPSLKPRLTARAVELSPPRASALIRREHSMDGIIYLVGMVVILMAILSFLGFR